MRVQRLVMPGSGVGSWTLLGEDLAPVVPAERFLAYLASIERSPNTVRAYAHDLKDWFVFLAGRGVDWRSATLEDVGAFAGWLRLPPAGRDGRVAVLPSAPQRCGGSSVNRKLAAPDFVLRVPCPARRALGRVAGDECTARPGQGFVVVVVQAVPASHQQVRPAATPEASRCPR